MKNKLTVFLLVAACTALNVSATTFYVDYAGGSDAANGLSGSSAWQHCPGDKNAVGIPAVKALAPGDNVIFKGGVHYRGTIVCNASGAAGKSIVYDGNSMGTFGNGTAVIDGADPLTGWTQCVSAADCGGNTNWQHIYKTTVPADMDVFVANMYADNEMLWPAQDPNVSDPFYPDDLTTYKPVHSDNVTRSNLVDSSYFTQSNSAYYAGAYIRLWGNPNVVRILPIVGYSPTENKVTFAYTGDNSLYTDRTVYYAVANHILHIDVPGEFSVNETTHTAYLWPLVADNPNGQNVTMSTRRLGIYINGQSNLVIQGFKIQKMTSGASEWGNGCAILDKTGGSNITIKDNELTLNYSHEKQGALRMYGNADNIGTNMLIENNNIHLNPHNKGIVVTVHDSMVRNNILRKNGSTALDFYGCNNSQMLGNTVTENTGGHANGLTLYLDCSNCLVAYNTVYDGNVALTIQDAKDITVAYNVLHTSQDTYTAVDWGGGSHGSDGIYYYNNVILNSYGKALAKGGATVNVTVRNNILDGYLGGSGSNISHNIYTSLAWTQLKEEWSLGIGEFVETNKNLIFISPASRDFHLKNGSPAIDSAINLGLTRDHAGAVVPQGDKPDIGSFEYIGGNPRFDGSKVLGSRLKNFNK